MKTPPTEHSIQATAESPTGPGAQPPARGAGTPPSNTVPANDISEKPVARILRLAIDSLYLSYPGQLAEEWDKRLTLLKGLAQSPDPREQAHAQVTLVNHLFEVKDHGKGRFRYVLVNNWYHLQISGLETQALPLAYVQISSELLTRIGPEAAERDLWHVINTLGMNEGARVSRIDLCVDFTSSLVMDSWTKEAWVTRAGSIDQHSIHQQFTGWSIGKGGDLSARLYDKTQEIQTSKKTYLYPLWEQAGWTPGETVWRLELQFRGKVFNSKMLKELPVMLAMLASLWHYGMTEWLRLTLPNPTDSVRSRWPTHPLWATLTELPWESLEIVPLERPRKDRAPSDEFLFVHGLGPVTSFMAREGIEDWSEGFGEYIAQAKAFHEHKGTNQFTAYIDQKVKEKERRFNTRDNNPGNDQALETLLQRAKADRKAKHGE